MKCQQCRFWGFLRGEEHCTKLAVNRRYSEPACEYYEAR